MTEAESVSVELFIAPINGTVGRQLIVQVDVESVTATSNIYKSYCLALHSVLMQDISQHALSVQN